MTYRKNFDHWTIKYRSGAIWYVLHEETAKSEALMNPDGVLAIYPPLFRD